MISAEILRRYPYFTAADDEELRALAVIFEEVAVPAGTVMYREDDKADKLYILVEGEVDIQYTLGSGELRTADTIVPGELLMWSALVEPYKSTAVVTARQNSRLIAVDADETAQRTVPRTTRSPMKCCTIWPRCWRHVWKVHGSSWPRSSEPRAL